MQAGFIDRMTAGLAVSWRGFLQRFATIIAGTGIFDQILLDIANQDVRLFRQAAATLGVTGNVVFVLDNTYDIGASGATRPRIVFVGSYVETPQVNTNFVGTVINGAMSLFTNNVNRWTVQAAGHLVAFLDNTYDIGASGATRPRRVYAGTEVVVPQVTTAAVGQVNAADLGLFTGNATRWSVLSAGHFVPFTDNAFDVGTAGALRPRRIYMGTSLVLRGFTVATLPAGVAGDTAYVTDALGPAFLAAVVGGGAVVTPVFYNGAAWVVG